MASLALFAASPLSAPAQPLARHGAGQPLRPLAPARPARSRRSLAAAASAPAAPGPLPGHSSMGPWERLQLAKRKLEVAIAEEDFARAAEAKREIETLQGRLPANLALMACLMERLERGGLPEGEAVAAVRQLGELGEWPAAPVLVAALHDGDDAVAAAAEDALWQLFLKCPTGELQAMMSEGVVLMRRPEQWDAARQLFDAMVRKAPTFAEAYNKRATVAFLQQRYHEAIADCKVALEMNPWHFKAAAGLGLCCAAVGDVPGAIAGYQHALALNPRMRHLRTHILALQRQLSQQRQVSE